MHDYLFRPEVVRVALVIGVVVSVLFYERVQLTTGGAIVPAYLAMFLLEPIYVVSTLMLAYTTYLIVNKVVTRRWILYGRRRFEIEVLVGLALILLLTVLAGDLDEGGQLAGVAGLGLLVPGIVAHDMFRQRPQRTLVALTATTIIVAAAVFVFAALLEISPLEETPMPSMGTATGYPADLIVYGAAASVLAGMVTFSVLGLRSGGFISAAYLALLALRPWELAWAAGLALLIWFIVTRWVMPNLPMFGRRKLSGMIMVGVVVAWTAEVTVSTLTSGAFQPWRGFVLMALMVPALLANDAQRQGPERTLWGAAVSTCLVFGVMNLVHAILIASGAA